MKNSTSISRFFAGLPLAVLVAASQVPAHAGTPEQECRAAIGSSLSRWILQNLKARHRCFVRVIQGKAIAGTDCLDGTSEPVLRGQLLAASADLHKGLANRCAEVSWGLLSYPGPCGGDIASFDASALSQCIEQIGGGVISTLLRTWYPSTAETTRGPASTCMRGIPRQAAAMVYGELRARVRCLLDSELEPSRGVDCRAQQVPYGPGTGDATVDRSILGAHRAWLSGMPAACAIASFPSLGYGDGCAEPLGVQSALLDLQTCVYSANRLRVAAILDVAFPSDPVCGNGIVQEGEACDAGPGNSDTASDACRIDCTLPFCGDGTADTAGGEECDDGDLTDLDGCNGSCELEICGDGIVNNQPSETCDDGNRSPNDLCTNACEPAVCGDGVVCSDAACTSGPNGGPEICDLGAANSENGQCHPDCFGYTRECTLTIGVTNTVSLGALTYELSYAAADGEFREMGSAVDCTSLLTGGLASFFDDKTKRKLRESVIVDKGFQAPGNVATCDYLTNDTALSAGDFSFKVLAASEPDFDPATANMAVTSITCVP